MLERKGYREDTYWTFGYSRIAGPDGPIGVLVTAIETTAAVLDDRRFRAMADDVATMIFTLAPTGEIDWTNARWRSYTRLPDDEIHTVEGWARCIPSDDLAKALAVRAEAVADVRPYEVELRIKPADGADDAYRWFLVQTVPAFGSTGKLERWVGTGTDVHERKSAGLARHAALELDFEREHGASVAFQNAALPQSLPTVPGFRSMPSTRRPSRTRSWVAIGMMPSSYPTVAWQSPSAT